jgi:hypothetical protein
MKTEPTISIAGTAASSLTYQAIESGNRAARQLNLKPKPSTAITDVLETTDRDGNGRQPPTSAAEHAPMHPNQSSDPAPENGDSLDLTG